MKGHSAQINNIAVKAWNFLPTCLNRDPEEKNLGSKLSKQQGRKEVHARLNHPVLRMSLEQLNAIICFPGYSSKDVKW